MLGMVDNKHNYRAEGSSMGYGMRQFWRLTYSFLHGHAW
jgi:hypothetical protein